MERRLQSAELELRAERAGQEATQTHLLEADEGASEMEAAWEAQRQILVDDSDRLRENLQVITRERDELSLKVEALFSKEDKIGTGNNTVDKNAFDTSGINLDELVLERQAYQAEVSELSSTITSLREEVHSKDNTMRELQRYVSFIITVPGRIVN